MRAKAINILRTRMATASPINAPNELTAKSAQSAVLEATLVVSVSVATIKLVCIVSLRLKENLLS